MSRFALIVLVLIGASYLTLRRRRVDAFTVAFFSSAMYFLPGLVGYTLSPVTPTSPVKLPIRMVDEAAFIMALVVGAILLGALAWDTWRGPRSRQDVWRIEDASLAPVLALTVGVLGVALTWLESGGAAFAADKRVVIAVVGRGHLVWEMGAILAATLATTYRRNGVLIGAFLLLLLDMYIGFRFAFAIAFISCVWLRLDTGYPMRLRDIPPRLVAMVLLGGLAIISYQNLKDPVRKGDWVEIGARVSDPLWYLNGIMTSEPFTTQTVLNEVVRNDFRTGNDHLMASSQHLIVFAPALGAEAARFNEQFQRQLFPSVDHGLANNIWAQMWSAGGLPLLVVFVAFYVAILALGSRLMCVRDPAIRALVATFWVFWCFYMHRNELLTQVGYQKQVLLTWAACVIGAILVAAAAVEARASKGMAGAG